ncbi:MAG: hypothetical protein RL235_956 [Chlamydiota bacterium]|jgi:uncharacterized protein with beta-barrel porin domain
MTNERHSIAQITSTSHLNGWLLLPHLEINSPWALKNGWCFIDPFLMLDWANNWQGGTTERGSSGFNLVLDHEYTSLLRSELGLRFMEKISFTSGRLVLIEKGSYVRKDPFHAGPSTTFFVGSASSFGIDVFSNQTQNLGAVQFQIQWIPCAVRDLFGSLSYQGVFGRRFASNELSCELGKNF